MDREQGIDRRLRRALLAENDPGIRRLLVALLVLNDRSPPNPHDPSSAGPIAPGE
jgi:hypothetical protein